MFYTQRGSLEGAPLGPVRPAGRKTEFSVSRDGHLEAGHPKGRDPAGEDTSLILQVLGVDRENT